MAVDPSLAGQAGPRVVTLPSEIDVTNSGQARAELEHALADGPAVLVADMTGTRFCDCSGVRALLGAQDAAAAAGAQLRVAGPGPLVRRLLAVTGAAQRLAVYPDLATALARPAPALRAARRPADRSPAHHPGPAPVRHRRPGARTPWPTSSS